MMTAFLNGRYTCIYKNINPTTSKVYMTSSFDVVGFICNIYTIPSRSVSVICHPRPSKSSLGFAPGRYLGTQVSYY